MSGLPSTGITPIAPVPGEDYVAGTCNIGPWEIRRRRSYAVLAFVAAAIALGGLVAVGAPGWTRLVLLLPLWGGCFSWLQARRRFCAAYAVRGASNFGVGLATLRPVVDRAAHEADLSAVRRMARDSLLLALPVTALLVLLPA